MSLPSGASVAFGLPAQSGSLVEPVALRSEGSGGGSTRWTARRRLLGSVSHENAGAQGSSLAPGVLEVSRLPRALRPGEPVSAKASAGTASVDAALIQPLAGGCGRASSPVASPSPSDDVSGAPSDGATGVLPLSASARRCR